jgi:exosortase A-associated hydrolase 2
MPVPHVAEPLFLPARPGQRFCVYHAPQGACKGAVLYLQPFGDEMNKARRMAALQSRELAELGYGVLQIDLYGCGDSSGDFNDARWDIWLADAALGIAWLRDKLGQPVSVWGLRTGALLALEAARADGAIARVALWQPVPSGATFLTQFLRLRTANAMLAEDGDKNSGTKALRDTLRGGASLEVAGYEIAPELADALEAREAIKLGVPGCPVHWFDIGSGAARAPTVAVTRVTSAWEEQGVDVTLHQVDAQQFWATQEITECPSLLAATSSVFADRSAA